MGVNKVFVRNIKKWRKNAGISQKRLAELCDSAHSYIRQIECGSRSPSFAFIEKLAGALNIAPYLLFYDEKMNKIDSLEKITKAEKELIAAISGNIHKAFDKLKDGQ